MPIAITQLGRPDELRRREFFDQRQAHREGVPISVGVRGTR
jgi:hypothetical protein